MKKILRLVVAVLAALVAITTLGPESAWARGGGGFGGGGGRGGRGGGRGGRGGGMRGRGGRQSNARFDGKNTAGYIEQLQREQADYERPDFLARTRDEALRRERDRSRAVDLAAERDDAAAERREDQEAGAHPK